MVPMSSSTGAVCFSPIDKYVERIEEYHQRLRRSRVEPGNRVAAGCAAPRALRGSRSAALASHHRALLLRHVR
jgi:hypothetical protein